MSYNRVYQKDGSGKWSNAREVTPPSGPILKPATAAAAEKSRANRVAKAKLATAEPPHHSSAYSGGAKAYAVDRTVLNGRKGSGKKYGAGHGSYTWGVPGDEDMDFKLNSKDPNYDSMDDEEDEDIIFSVLEHHEKMARKAGISTHGLHGSGHMSDKPTIVHPPSSSQLPPKIPLAEFKKLCVNLVDEYLVSEDVDELCDTLVALHSPMLHYEFVRRAITLGMERNARERELVSEALSELYGRRILTSEAIGKGFERLFDLADDLELDIPRARKYISQFLARAVADELLPPSFLAEPLFEQLGGEIVEQAKILLSIKHGMVRLEHVWGPSAKSVDELKHEIKMLLEEFLSSSDMDEACSCVKRLNVPHFHHEVVKRAVVLSLDCHEREQAMMSSLLAELYVREIVSQKQMQIGFQRLYDSLSDLELDAPGATQVLDVFLKQAVKDICLTEESATAIKSTTQKK